MYIEDSHIQEWINEGNATIVPVEVASQLAQYVNQLPWNIAGTRLDWNRLDGIEVDLSSMSDQDVFEWLGSTSLKDDPFIIFWFAPNEPCLACPFKFAAFNLDTAYWKVSGGGYLFGATYDESGWRPNLAHFAEYNGINWLTATK